MSRIAEAFADLKKKNQKAFVAYITAGDPNLEETKAYCRLLAKAGVDIIELGVPFSDPLADGPTNQAAAERALASGTSLAKILQMVAELRSEGFSLPLVLFSYLNPIFSMGYENFAQQCRKVGVDGVLVLDLPIEEAAPYIELMRRQEVKTVFLASPTTTDERLQLVGEQTQGFLYYVSRTGVTGAQAEISKTLEDEVNHLKEYVNCPIVVGFGISTVEQAKFVSSLGDGIVIGSAIVKLIENRDQVEKRLSSFVRQISQAINT